MDKESYLIEESFYYTDDQLRYHTRAVGVVPEETAERIYNFGLSNIDVVNTKSDMIYMPVLALDRTAIILISAQDDKFRIPSQNLPMYSFIQDEDFEPNQMYVPSLIDVISSDIKTNHLTVQELARVAKFKFLPSNPYKTQYPEHHRNVKENMLILRDNLIGYSLLEEKIEGHDKN